MRQKASRAATRLGDGAPSAVREAKERRVSRQRRASDPNSLLAQDVLLDSPHVRVVRETVRTPSRPDGREWTKV
ncbi:MAG: hypothetical protein ACKOJB_06560, partial [Chthoniobacterales bacterium]